MMRGPEPVVGSGPHRSWNRGELQEVHSADRYVRQLVIRVVDEDVRDEAALGLELRPPGTAVPVVLDVLALRLAQDANVGRPGQEIGRASCRERVSTTVVADAVQKKKEGMKARSRRT